MSIYINQTLINNESLADQPLTHARICWQSVTGTITGTVGDTGFPLTSAFNPATYERYRPSGGVLSEIVIDCLTSANADYLAMQLSGSTSIALEASTDNTSWLPVHSATLNNDKVAMLLFQEISYRYFKIIITGTAIEVVSLMIGKSLAMQREIHSGISPMNLSPTRIVRPNVSGTGQWLGSSLQRVGYSASFNWDNLTNDWYRQNFDLLNQNTPRANPFFIAWRPITYQDDVTYCLATNDIAPSYTGTRNFMSVALSVEGFSDDGQ